MSDEKNFVSGMLVKLPDGNAPDFVKLKLSFKLDEFGACYSAVFHRGVSSLQGSAFALYFRSGLGIGHRIGPRNHR